MLSVGMLNVVINLVIIIIMLSTIMLSVGILNVVINLVIIVDNDQIYSDIKHTNAKHYGIMTSDILFDIKNFKAIDSELRCLGLQLALMH
jgi:hypothetical protein